MTEPRRACPACGVGNLASRELCVTCGADLDSGQVPPRPARRGAPDPPVFDPEPIQHARWLVPLVAAVAVALLLAVGLTLAGLGPFVRSDIPSASFDEDRYPEAATRLVLSDVATRTTATDDDAPVRMVDEDPSTAWRSAITSADLDDGLDETIDLFLAEPAWVQRLLLRNGDQTDPAAYARSARLRRVTVRFDGGHSVLADLLDLGLEGQELVLPEPVLTKVVRIDVERAFSGAEDHLAVAEIALEGWVATGDDVDLAARRAEVRPATDPVAWRGAGGAG